MLPSRRGEIEQAPGLHNCKACCTHAALPTAKQKGHWKQTTARAARPLAALVGPLPATQHPPHLRALHSELQECDRGQGQHGGRHRLRPQQLALVLGNERCVHRALQAGNVEGPRYGWVASSSWPSPREMNAGYGWGASSSRPSLTWRDEGSVHRGQHYQPHARRQLRRCSMASKPGASKCAVHRSMAFSPA